MRKRPVTYGWQYTTNTNKKTSTVNVFGPYLKAVIYYGEAGLSTCIYIGSRFVFPTLILSNAGRWKKFIWRR